MKKIAFFAVICILALVLFLSRNNNTDALIHVETVTAQPSSNLICVNASGSLEAYRTRKLGVTSYAVADRIYLNVGDPVAEGQVIMTFNPASAPAISAELDELLATANLSGELSDSVDSVIADTLSADELVSPFDGVVTSIAISEGEQASPLAAIAEVSDLSRIRARVRLGESDMNVVKVGMPADVTSSGETYSAVVIEVSPVIRTSTGITGSVERYCEAVLELYLPEGATPGSSATATVYAERRTGMVTLPFSAIGQDELNREYVYVVSDGAARMCFVTTGREFGSEVEILSGIYAGEEVIMKSDGSLYNGAPVEVE